MATIKLITSPAAMAEVCEKTRLQKKSLGLVPTLGALHEGHLSLIETSVKENDVTVVSVFVNPLQFRKKAYNEYPRDLENDLAKAGQAGAAMVFAPEAEDMYPDGFSTQLRIPRLFAALKAQNIEWHYRGVLTVVLKLLNIINPHRAYFGLKDPHQLALIERMAADLNLPVELRTCETVREPDGLARSSRNRQLTGAGRKAAPVIHRALAQAEKELKKGRAPAEIARDMELTINAASRPGVEVRTEYIELSDADTLQPLNETSGTALIFVAAWVDGLRLTDNIRVSL